MTSEYEKIREKNIAEREALMKRLKLVETAQDVAKMMSRNTWTPKARKVLRKPRRLSPASPQLLRRSARLSAKIAKVQYSDNATHTPSGEDGDDSTLSAVENFKASTRQVLRPRNVVRSVPKDDSSVSSWHSDFESLEAFGRRLTKNSLGERFANWNEDFEGIKKQLNQLTFAGKFKVIEARGSALCVHPSKNLVAMIVGDKHGNLSIATIDRSEDKFVGCQTYSRDLLHEAPISCVAVDICNQNVLFTSSYDGTLKRFDFTSGTAGDILMEKINESCRYFDFVSPNVVLLAVRRGSLKLIDCRSPSQLNVKSIHVDDDLLRTVQIHPNRRDYFITSSTNGFMNIYDVRNSSKAVSSVAFENALHSAFFSPNLGNKVVATSLNDTLNVFDSKNFVSGEITKLSSIKHDNHVGRWLSPFLPVWHPKSDEIFVCGNMKSSNRIVEVFDDHCKVLRTFDDATTICSLNAFHNESGVAVGINASGYLHVWTL